MDWAASAARGASSRTSPTGRRGSIKELHDASPERRDGGRIARRSFAEPAAEAARGTPRGGAAASGAVARDRGPAAEPDEAAVGCEANFEYLTYKVSKRRPWLPRALQSGVLRRLARPPTRHVGIGVSTRDATQGTLMVERYGRHTRTYDLADVHHVQKMRQVGTRRRSF